MNLKKDLEKRAEELKTYINKYKGSSLPMHGISKKCCKKEVIKILQTELDWIEAVLKIS